MSVGHSRALPVGGAKTQRMIGRVVLDTRSLAGSNGLPTGVLSHPVSPDAADSRVAFCPRPHHPSMTSAAPHTCQLHTVAQECRTGSDGRWLRRRAAEGPSSVAG